MSKACVKSYPPPSYLYLSDDYGNDVLYDFCLGFSLENADEDELEKVLASQMWAIGRSYAAVPERYRYGKSEARRPVAIWERGYDSFFGDVARQLVNYRIGNVEIFPRFVQELIQAQTRSYRFDGARTLAGIVSESDKEAFVCALRTVLTFQLLLRGSIILKDLSLADSSPTKDEFHKTDYCRSLSKGTIDEKDEGIVTNQEFVKEVAGCKSIQRASDVLGLSFFDSFCSKFIHFHVPKIVFIYDSVTSAHLRPLSKKGSCKWSGSNVCISKEALSQIGSENKIDEIEGRLYRDGSTFQDLVGVRCEEGKLTHAYKKHARAYIRHRLKCYAVGEQLLTGLSESRLEALDSSAPIKSNTCNLRHHSYLTRYVDSFVSNQPRFADGVNNRKKE